MKYFSLGSKNSKPDNLSRPGGVSGGGGEGRSSRGFVFLIESSGVIVKDMIAFSISCLLIYLFFNFVFPFLTFYILT